MAKLTDETRASLRRRSRLVNLGRDVEFSQGFVNVPPFRGSTVLYPDVATLKSRAQRFTYGTRGTPTTEALSSAWSELAGAAGTVLAPSGLAAIIVALMTALKAGDHLLMTDSVYEPSRAFADKALRRFGIETSYYDPTIGAGIDALMRPNTRAVLTESPGSLTLEVQDIPAIAEVAHARGHAPVTLRAPDLRVELGDAPFEYGDQIVDANRVLLGRVEPAHRLGFAREKLPDPGRLFEERPAFGRL